MQQFWLIERLFNGMEIAQRKYHKRSVSSLIYGTDI